jgi:multiple sugar transport system substrate-binding protein
MKRQIYFNKAIFLLAGVIFLSAGCGGGSTTQSGPTTLNVWMPFEDSENMQPLISDYLKNHPGLNIVYTKKSINTYENDLLNALASGTGPDIFAIHNDWLPKYTNKITPAPAKTFLYKDFKDTFIDVIAKDFTDQNSKVYGVSMAVDSLGLYYNKDLLGTAGIATPPKTWTELALDVQRIRRSDGRGYFTRSGVAMGTNANVNRGVDILYLFMLQQGAQPFSGDLLVPTFGENSQVNGNLINPGQTALSFYTSFADPTSVNYNWNLRSDYSIDAFANGRAAFLYNYSYTRQTILQKNPNLNFDAAPVPQPNLDNPSVNFANYWGEVVSKQSKNSNLAWDFLKFITSKTELDKYYVLHKQPSSRKDLIDLQVSDPNIGVFANANLTAKSFYKPDQVKMDNIFGQMIDNVILNGLSATDALSQAEQQAATLTRE